MPQCDPQIFPDITPEQFACLVAKAAAQGIEIAGNSGSASRDGVTIAWDYDDAGQILTLQCTASPFFIPCNMINARLQGLVDSCTS